jgi:hypothetical protein
MAILLFFNFRSQFAKNVFATLTFIEISISKQDIKNEKAL